MSKLLKVFDLVPGWVWAVGLAVATVLCVLLDSGRANARAEAAVARQELIAVQLVSRDVILDEMAKSRAKEAPLIDKVQEANNAVSQARLDLGAAAAAADERLRKFARPVAICVRRADAGAGAASASGVAGGEQEPARLREVDGRDLLVIDGQARVELGQHSAAANLARQALSECLSTWQAAHMATRPDAASTR